MTVSTPRRALRNEAGVAQVAQGELHAHALAAQPRGVAHEAANGLPGGHQASQEGRTRPCPSRR